MVKEIFCDDMYLSFHHFLFAFPAPNRLSASWGTYRRVLIDPMRMIRALLFLSSGNPLSWVVIRVRWAFTWEQGAGLKQAVDRWIGWLRDGWSYQDFVVGNKEKKRVPYGQMAVQLAKKLQCLLSWGEIMFDDGSRDVSCRSIPGLGPSDEEKSLYLPF